MFTIAHRERSEAREAPFRFGDVVIAVEDRFVDIRHSEVLHLPDTGNGDALAFCIAHPAEGRFPYECSDSDWNTIKRVGEYSDLPDDVKKNLEPYRKGVVVNGLHSDKGIDIFDDSERMLLREVVDEPSTRNSILGTGTHILFKSFYSTEYKKWRVFTHRRADWSTWDMLGPFDNESSARQAFESSIEESKRNPPLLLRHGVYENTGQINVVVLYEGLEKRDYWTFLIGQGE